jgi:hypothetical protein
MSAATLLLSVVGAYAVMLAAVLGMLEYAMRQQMTEARRHAIRARLVAIVAHEEDIRRWDAPGYALPTKGRR